MTYIYFRDTRPRLNPQDYTVSSLHTSEIVKLPGTIEGQQFIIKNCINSRIYLFDFSSSITIDDCNDCLFVLGPVQGRYCNVTYLRIHIHLILSVSHFGPTSILVPTAAKLNQYRYPYSSCSSARLLSSIFLRDSKNCTLVCASSQLRLRDCEGIHLFVGCESDPIIEASSGVIVGPYFLSYKGIEGIFLANSYYYKFFSRAKSNLLFSRCSLQDTSSQQSYLASKPFAGRKSMISHRTSNSRTGRDST
jgi:protein XRP2